MPTPFIIYGLPRSRTNWLSHFLTYRDWKCLHEASGYLRQVGEIAELFTLNGGRIGISETGASPAWRLVHHYVPNLKTVVVRRPMEEVRPSLRAYGERYGVVYDERKLHTVLSHGARAIDRIAARPGVLVVDFADLVREETCRAIFEHCLPYEFDREHWLAWKDVNMQADFRPAIANYLENREAIEAFKSALWRDLRRLAKEGSL